MPPHFEIRRIEKTPMRILIVLVSLLLASCSNFSNYLPTFKPHKVEIRQGNYVSPEMKQKLKVGMTKAQVRHVLGAPMVSDVFHDSRWDYVYRLEQGGKLVEQNKLALYFDGDNLVRAEEEGQPLLIVPASEPIPAQQEVAQPATATIARAIVEIDPVAVTIDPAKEVSNSVQAWAAAWEAKDTQAYLAMYAPQFKPEGMSRKGWEKLRIARIGKPKSIEVALSEMQVGVQDASHATASFKQDYRSDHYRDSVYKTLQLEKIGDAWQIVAEQVAK